MSRPVLEAFPGVPKGSEIWTSVGGSTARRGRNRLVHCIPEPHDRASKESPATVNLNLEELADLEQHGSERLWRMCSQP